MVRGSSSTAGARVRTAIRIELLVRQTDVIDGRTRVKESLNENYCTRLLLLAGGCNFTVSCNFFGCG